MRETRLEEISSLDELKATIESSKPKINQVWIKDGEWFFYQKEGAVRYNASQILSSDSIDNIPDAQEESNVQESEIINKKRRNK